MCLSFLFFLCVWIHSVPTALTKAQSLLCSPGVFMMSKYLGCGRCGLLVSYFLFHFFAGPVVCRQRNHTFCAASCLFQATFQPLLRCVKFPGAFLESFYALLLPLLVSIVLYQRQQLFIVIRHSCFDILYFIACC